LIKNLTIKLSSIEE
jgi:hypothetical protein